MRKDRQKALTLRLKGYSYNEIALYLGVPKSTLSGWFTGLILPETARLRIMARVREGTLRGLIKKNKIQTHQARQRAFKIRSESSRQIGNLSKRELLLIGAAFYWAEGYKKPTTKNGRERTYHAISFTNSDSAMVKLFLNFLEYVVKIPREKIRASIRIYQHINENEALRYWQAATNLPKENFRKSYYGVSKSSLGKRPYNRLPYGTIQINIGDTKSFHRVMGWIEGIKRTLTK